MESIRDVFKEKGFSDEVLAYLENTINEFKEMLGSYVSQEDLIERVKSNIDAIEFVDEIDGRSTGRYDYINKKIEILRNLDEENIKHIFFHEFLHAIAFYGNDKGTGFYEFYTIIDIDGIFAMGAGFNEGFVEMLTRERDKKFANNANKKINLCYPILTAAVEKFADLLGREELLELYFNDSNSFFNFLDEKFEQGILGLTSSWDFLLDFDTIHEHEDEIFEVQMKPWMQFFKAQYDNNGHRFDSSKVYRAQEGILQGYLHLILTGQLENSTELEDVLNKVRDMCDILSVNISREIVAEIVDVSNPNALANVSMETKELINSELLFRKFKNLNTKEKLLSLTSQDNEFMNACYRNLWKINALLAEEYLSLMMCELYEGTKSFVGRDIFALLRNFCGVAEYIVRNDLSFENLKIIYNKYHEYGFVFELYNLEEDGEYERVTTLFVDYDFDTKECKELGVTERAKLSDYISKKGMNCFEAFGNGNGDFVAHNEKGQIFVSTFASNKFREILRPIHTIDIESINEMKLKEINRRRETFVKNMHEREGIDTVTPDEQQTLENFDKERETVLESIRQSSRKKINPIQAEGNRVEKIDFLKLLILARASRTSLQDIDFEKYPDIKEFMEMEIKRDIDKRIEQNPDVIRLLCGLKIKSENHMLQAQNLGKYQIAKTDEVVLDDIEFVFDYTSFDTKSENIPEIDEDVYQVLKIILAANCRGTRSSVSRYIYSLLKESSPEVIQKALELSKELDNSWKIVKDHSVSNIELEISKLERLNAKKVDKDSPGHA